MKNGLLISMLLDRLAENIFRFEITDFRGWRLQFTLAANVLLLPTFLVMLFTGELETG
ncbi:MAG: hypothetical protein ACE5OZ_01200 [Candidatus Heimdallarchaeota archaeon]